MTKVVVGVWLCAFLCLSCRTRDTARTLVGAEPSRVSGGGDVLVDAAPVMADAVTTDLGHGDVGPDHVPTSGSPLQEDVADVGSGDASTGSTTQGQSDAASSPPENEADSTCHPVCNGIDCGSVGCGLYCPCDPLATCNQGKCECDLFAMRNKQGKCECVYKQCFDFCCDKDQACAHMGSDHSKCVRTGR